MCIQTNLFRTQLSLELSSKFLSKLDDDKAKRLENMLYRIRTDVNARGSCMLQDGQENLLSLCIVPFYEDKLDEIENMGNLAHKSPALLDSFLENYALNSWDLTTQKVIHFVIVCINSLPVQNSSTDS